VKTKFLAAVAFLLAGGQAAATTISLDFSTLPTAQGWTYFTSGAAESDVFSVSGGVLSMNGTLTNAAYYKLEGVVDPLLPFIISARARVLSGGQTLAFYAATSSEFAAINLSPTRIIDETSAATLATIDNTTFHDYRLEGAFGSGYQLFVDNTLIAAGAVGAYPVNLLLLGDSGSFGGGRAEISAYSFQQSALIPEPATLILVLSGLGVLSSRRRRRT